MQILLSELCSRYCKLVFLFDIIITFYWFYGAWRELTQACLYFLNISLVWLWLLYYLRAFCVSQLRLSHFFLCFICFFLLKHSFWNSNPLYFYSLILLSSLVFLLFPDFFSHKSLLVHSLSLFFKVADRCQWLITSDLDLLWFINYNLHLSFLNWRLGILSFNSSWRYFLVLWLFYNFLLHYVLVMEDGVRKLSFKDIVSHNFLYSSLNYRNL